MSINIAEVKRKKLIFQVPNYENSSLCLNLHYYINHAEYNIYEF